MKKRVVRRKVPQPSAGISLNSWGNPPTQAHPLALHASGGRPGVCVLMCINYVCGCVGVCGGGVQHCNCVLGGRVGMQGGRELNEATFLPIHDQILKKIFF